MQVLHDPTAKMPTLTPGTAGTVIVEFPEQGTTTHLRASLELLCEHSPFFSAAFKSASSFKETVKGRISLPENEPVGIRSFLNFIHTGNIHTADDAATRAALRRDRPSGDEFAPEWHRLELAWFFGNQILSTSFKDAVTDRMLELWLKEKSVPPTYIGFYIYPESHPKSPVRSLMVHLMVWAWPYVDCHPVYFWAPGDEKVLLGHYEIEWAARYGQKGERRGKEEPNDDRLFDPLLNFHGCRYHEHSRDPLLIGPNLTTRLKSH